MVEDDLVAQMVLRTTLHEHGYAVTAVASAEAAQEQLGIQGFDYFDCVVTDHWMSGLTGLELIEWINAEDANLATIMITATSDKDIVTESLRRGVMDFLEKPVSLQKLFSAVARAVGRTQLQRQMLRSDSAVKDLGRAQLWMAQTGQPVGKLQVDICLHPKLEAGGDCLGHFQISPEQYCCILTDVSGHDLQAAYISAYFQGVFRGMLQRSAPLAEIFAYFNDFLVYEWNQGEQLKAKNSVGTSLAATAVLLDSRRQTASVLICGAPAPIYVLPDGRARVMGDNSGPPLGWFPHIDIETSVHPTQRGGAIYLWTDGLNDLAEAQGLHPLCLAFALRRAKEKSAAAPWLDDAADDILCSTIHLPHEEQPERPLEPLIVEPYRGDQVADIDAVVADWRRNLKFAFPGINDTTEYNILLASREALLNALIHGCRRQAEKVVLFQMTYHPARDAVRIHVDDPGNGHEFDFTAHEEQTEVELIDEHRGLIFITNLAQSVKFERDGASLTLDFQL